MNLNNFIDKYMKRGPEVSGPPLTLSGLRYHIREACAEAYADGRKAERRRLKMTVKRHQDGNCNCIGFNDCFRAIYEILNPKRRGGR